MNLLDQVISFLGDHDVDAYLVGGLVRDQLLKRAEKRDIDLAIVGDASELAREFANASGGAFYLMDEEHNVARVIMGDTYIDFAEMRGNLREDLGTRDFTINAMARQLGSDELIDPFHGQRDLREKRVRAVSDQVFHNDPVRLLRGVRIAGELGFSIEPHTEALMRSDESLLAYASMERARDEFCKILAQDNAADLLRQMDDLGLLNALLPEVGALKGVTQSLPHIYDVFNHTMHAVDELVKIQLRGYVDVANGEFVGEIKKHMAQKVSAERTRGTLLRLTALLHDIGKPVTRMVEESGRIRFFEHEPRGAEMAETLMRRLRFSNDEINIVKPTIENHLRPALLSVEPHISNRAVYRFFRDAGDAGIDVCVLTMADQRARMTPTIDETQDAILRGVNATLLDRYYHTPVAVIAPPPLVDGRALMKELNLGSGPQIGELLEAIREAQAEGEVKTREDALEYARRQVKK